jgi:hypothetical protein
MEPSGYNYSRVTTSAGIWTTPISGATNTQPIGHGVVVNNTAIPFATPSGSWGSVISTAVLGLASGGNYQPLFYGTVRPELNISGGTLQVGVGTFHIEIKGHGFANSTRDQVLLGAFGGGAAYWPATYSLSLLSTLPEPDGTGLAEIQTPGVNGYARVTVGNNTTSFTTATTGITYNNTMFTFPAPTGPWGAVATAWALMDATSGGTMWFYGPLDPAISVTAGSLPPQISAGRMQISLDALRSL